MGDYKLNTLERTIIELIRKKKHQTVTVKIKDGGIVNVKVEESIDLDSLGNGKNPSL